MIKVTVNGNFDKIDKFFKGVITTDYVRVLEKYARDGIMALKNATPVDSGETVNSWDYEIRHYPGGASIAWTNSHVVDGVPIAIILQYGHATRNGGYVQGRDYINPALRPIFEKMANDLWEEVTNI